MKLIFEKSVPGRRLSTIGECDVPVKTFASEHLRSTPPRLPEVSENDLTRHYKQLADQTFGVNDGFYPLGSCTMKYNPKINERTAALPGFSQIHPLQPAHTATGAAEALGLLEKYLCEITGMDAMTFQPAAGAHGEYCGILLIKAYHEHRGDTARTKIIVPDSAHGTNPATAVMAGYTVVNIPSAPDGSVDVDALKKAVGPDTAGLMLTNPNTLGIFDRNILEITRTIHDAGGLCYYDGANLNAVMGIVRPGDMGFDVVHLNLHKTFSTPHGGGGPGSGPVGCKDLLVPFLPVPVTKAENDSFVLDFDRELSIGKIKGFYGNFLVCIRALTYILTLGKEGIPAAAEHAVLNANYMRAKLSDFYPAAFPGLCMHEFVMTPGPRLTALGVTALDIAKCILDRKMHPPTMYFPLIVHEALMAEPTETESKETLDAAIAAYIDIYNLALENTEAAHAAPVNTPIGRPDETSAARSPVLKYDFS